MIFANRYDAGRRLAGLLERYRAERPVLLALPRGGVPVAFEVARALGAPLDVCVARKLGVPGAEEVAMGAVAGGTAVVDHELIARLGIPNTYVQRVVAREIAEMARQEGTFRRGRAPIDVAGRTVILVDDGLATGATAYAAVKALRTRNPRRIVFASPVCAPDGAEMLRGVADDVICVDCPADFRAVGLWYEDFSPVSDAEVVDCLEAVAPGRISA
ncbi:MAG TPA: phosphoribosyltransferase family protein [Gemmatimonadales bacterium]|nr:phosphoribosyltransferase family protein [Gemmatimonadales bacterium]